jgi:outer membrane protein TolC
MRQSQLRQAMLLEDQQAFAVEAARNDAVLATRQYFSAIRDDAERIRALESARDSAQSSLDSSKIAQTVGVRTIIDVLNAEQNRDQTLYNLAAARYDYLLSQLQLAASAGALDEDALSRVNAGLHAP